MGAFEVLGAGFRSRERDQEIRREGGGGKVTFINIPPCGGGEGVWEVGREGGTGRRGREREGEGEVGGGGGRKEGWRWGEKEEVKEG